MARDFMARARELAERGRHTVAPNPLGGSLVVRNGEIAGEGFHARAGEQHAEVAALERCGGEARGATLCATLEPCNHHGRTPPCTEAIIEARISCVVIGHLDPDPRMRGRSVELLRDAGIEVEVAGDPELAVELGRQNERFFHYMATGRPFVHVKLAMTLDGRISSGSGPKRITGRDSRARVHLLRAEAGAVLVGGGTAGADDSLLDARHVALEVKLSDIIRIVLDPGLSLAPGNRLDASTLENPVVVFAAEESLDGREAALTEPGVEDVPTPRCGGELDLEFVLEELGHRGIRGLLVEGGGETVGRFAQAGLVDKMTLFYAPRLIGASGVPAVRSLEIPESSDGSGGPGFRVENVEKLGEEVAFTLYPSEPVSE